jgi:hypothetical protein
VIEPPQRDKLRALIEGLRPGDGDAYVVRCACDPVEGAINGRTVVDHIWLFPIRDDIRWTHRVHEQILPAIIRADIPVRWTDLTVRHTGYSDRALRGRKFQRDARILRNLRVGDELLLRDGRIEPIEGVRLYAFFGTVYNFELADLHC